MQRKRYLFMIRLEGYISEELDVGRVNFLKEAEL